MFSKWSEFSPTTCSFTHPPWKETLRRYVLQTASAKRESKFIHIGASRSRQLSPKGKSRISFSFDAEMPLLSGGLIACLWRQSWPTLFVCLSFFRQTTKGGRWCEIHFPYFLACGSGPRPEHKISRRVLSCQSKHTSVRLAHQLCVSRFGTVAVDSFFLLKTVGNSRFQLVGSLRCDQRLGIDETLSHRYSYSNLCLVLLKLKPVARLPLLQLGTLLHSPDESLD